MKKQKISETDGEQYSKDKANNENQNRKKKPKGRVYKWR